MIENVIDAAFWASVGGWIVLLILAWDKKRQWPYRWDCPEEGCDFNVKANDPTVVDRVQQTHTHN
jgi:hypothetical protein